MALTNDQLALARSIYELYWETYIRGDLKTFASTLDEDFEMIGTSESEVAQSKAEGIEFYKAQMAEVVGKVEMRNRQISAKPLNDMVLVNETCDIYVWGEPEWMFYSKIRISTLLHETASGWKVIQQHGSLPDMRVQEGETLALEKITKENLELRDAVKRRTIELENKNRELAIESALEKVRAVAMGIKKPEDMLEVCRIISDQLQDFGVEKIRNIQTAIIDEEKGIYLCYQYFTPYDKEAVERTEYLKSPVEHGMVRQMMASKDGHFTGTLSGRELEEFREHRKAEEHFPDPILDESKEISHCFLSIGEGGLGLTLYQPMDTSTLELFKRFHQVFSLAYSRFQDIQKAEARAREVEIELALERVRAQTMAMHSSEDVGKCVVKVFAELTALGVDEGTRFGIGILNPNNEKNQLWTARNDGEEVNMHIGNLDMSWHPLLKSAREAWKAQVPFHKYVLEGEDLLDYYQMLNNAPDYKIQIPLEKLPKKEIQHCFIFEHGFFYAFSPREFQPELIQITKRFSSLFEQTYRRYMDLVKAEAQAREAEIELALERVRARTMAMHHTEELKEVIQVIFDQFVGLNIHVEHAGFILDYKEKEDMNIWLATLQQGVPTEITIPYFDSPHWNSFLGAKAKGANFFANLLSFEVKNKFYQDLFEWIPELTEEAQQAIFNKPALAISTVLLDNVGLYIEHYSETHFTPEENAILMRFGKVFQQTYTRFLDLQKAEVQAKEAQIEAALEKVRSRSLAMHKSGELNEVVMELFERLNDLQIPVTAVGISINIQDSKDLDNYTCGLVDSGIAINNYRLPYFDHRIANDFFEAREKQLDFFVGNYSKQEKDSFYEYVINHTELKNELTEDIKQFIFQSPSYSISVVTTKNTMITLNDFEGKSLSVDEIDILKRFAKVFEQAYTRFLDLQKAEAQAREAQIEASLERVRSRSMAMHKSDELLQAGEILFLEMQKLGIESLTAGYVLIDKEGKNGLNYTPHPGTKKLMSVPVIIPHNETSHMQQVVEHWKKGNPFFIIEMDEEETIQHQTFIAERSTNFPLTAAQLIAISPSKLFLHNFYFKEGYVLIVGGTKLSGEQTEIMLRFAKVFQQTYTRFLDLQKAEAQARESQIEAALERVRSRSMAMHQSEELREVIQLMFEQFRLLNFNIDSAQFDPNYKETDDLNLWTAVPGQPYSLLLHIPYADITLFNSLNEAKKRGHSFITQHLSLEEKNQFFRHFFQHIKDIPVERQKLIFDGPGMYRAVVFMENVSLAIQNYSNTPYTEEENDVLKRFGKTFEQVYTRFLDLQKAEAQAREAQIEAGLERVRARTMAMQHSDELSESAFVLFQQLQILGLVHERINIGVVKEESKTIDFWITEQGGNQINTRFTGRIDEHTTLSKMYQGWKNKRKLMVIDQTGKDLSNWLKYLKEEIGIPFDPAFLHNRRVQTVGFFSKGMLVLTTPEPLPDEHLQLLEKFAGVFDLTYTRFSDLKQAEAQAREAQIEAALERIRAKGVAMHHSGELKDVLTVLFNQFDILGIKPVQAQLSLFDLENNKFSFRSTGKGGRGNVGEQVIDMDAMDTWKETIDTWKASKPKSISTVYFPKEILPQLWALFDEVRKQLPEEDIITQEDYPDGVYVTEGNFNYGYIGFSHSRKATAEEEDIVIRFATEFGRLYQRFLDLQKAESQAREAQIQLSLERIRAKAMSMQHSDELSGFLTVLFEQFKVLNLNPVNCHLNFLDIENNRNIFRITGKRGAALIATQEIDLDASPLWKKRKEDWKAGHPNDVDVLYVPYENHLEINAIFEELLSKLPKEDRPLPEDFPDGLYVIDGYCRYGYLGYSASKPPSDEEKEITRRIANEFGNVYQRFLDLEKAEAQAREAQIQLSLERIRAKAMSMQHSDELSDFLTVVFEQFHVLNLRPVASQLSFLDIDNNRSILRLTGKNGATLIATQEVDLDASPFWKQKVEDFKSGQPNDVDVLFVPYDKLPEIVEILKEILAKLPEDERPLPEDYPNGQYIVEGTFKYGYLGYSTTGPPSDEEKEITRRIANEFGNVYQRFLDLQKAEAQAREAQIEAALERVRAKTMAMHKSEQLPETAQVLFEQFAEFGKIPDRIAIGIIKEELQVIEWWVTDQMGSQLARHFNSSILQTTIAQFFTAWKEGKDSIMVDLSGEALKEWVAFVRDEVKMPIDDSNMKGRRVHHGAFFSHGLLLISAHEMMPSETMQLLVRFAKVFSQTYTRFLDLQKAEAQAREAQIEAALERVRNRSMAMHKSQELIYVVRVLDKEIKGLGIEINGTQILTDFNNLEEGVYSWFTTEGEDYLEKFHVPLFEHTLNKRISEAIQAGVDFYMDSYSGAEKNEYFKLLFKNSDFRTIPKERQDLAYSIPIFIRATVLSKNSILAFQRYFPKEFSEEEGDIFKRFGKVFDQAYTRFLDLQKAEAQAREAQIEVGLERVRARTMAMHSSDDVSMATATLFTELEKLGVQNLRGGITIISPDQTQEVWSVNHLPEGITLRAIGNFDMRLHPFWHQLFKAFKTKEEFQYYWLAGKDKANYIALLNTTPHYLEQPITDFPDVHIQSYFFGEGAIWTNSLLPHSEGDKQIMKKFVSVFSLTFRRYLDLQKAEAQARESQIQLAMERVRARTMAMQHSSELGETSALLFQQIQSLGVPPWSCGFNIWDQGDTVFTSYMGSPDGAILDGLKIPLTEEATFIHFQESRDRGDKLFVDVLEGETLEAHYRYFLSLPEIKKAFEKRAQAGDHRPTFQINHLANFSHGNLMFITYEHCPQAHDIFIRFAKVFEQTYTRFLDLQKAEAQAREAQIENALEKVRSRTMAMQRSDELTDVAGLLFNQVSALGIKTWTAGFNVWSEDNNSYVDYLSLNGEIYGPNTVHTEKAEALKDLSNARKSGVEFDVLYMEGEKIKQLHMALGGVDEKEYDRMLKDGLLPSHEYEHFVFGAKVSVMFITYEPVPEAHDIFKRLGKVFEQTYTRFLDLQKAEAQAREAKIETSLEKVRSRTMGMQSSEELPEVANLLFTEVRALGIHAWSCGYNILAEDKKSATCCMSSEGTLQTPFQLRLWGENSFKEMGEFVLSDHTMLVQELGGKALEEHYAYMKSFPDLKPTFDEIDRLGLSLPTYQINHLCKFNGGFILFITYEKVPESHAVFKRFTNVFDQTYTRFLDLKKAEAQARESEIEVAIEKVRSRSLAMHKSDELKDVVFSVFERLRDLQIQTDSTNIVVYHDESAKMEFWAANEMNYSMKFSLPMTGRFYPMEGIEARKAQKAYCQHLPFEEKNMFWKELFNTPDFRKVPEARKNFLLEKTECLIQLVAFGKVTGIMLNRHFNNPFSDAEIEIAERFAKVFDQAYTRFLDLQKAEAQAREAQIANALEKVRSRSLAMQSPDELIEVAQLLREEMGALGVEELETSSIYIQEDHSGSTQCWFTIKNPDNPEKAITDQMTLDLQDTWVGRKMDEFFHSKAKHTSILMQGKERIEWIRYCEKKSDLFGTSNFYGEKIPDRTYHLYKFSNGYIGAAAPGEISAESWDLLKRATAVFSFAYTRFRDLQMAQSSARAAMRQASLDRVRADISSMRNADDLGRITPLVFNELTTLGIPFIRCGVFIVHENKSNVEIYLSTPEGKSLAVMTLPFSANEMTSKSVEAWKKGEVYVQHWNQTDFINWGKSMQEQGYVKDLKTYQGAEAAPMSLHLHFVPFTQGLLYVGSTETLSEDQIDLVKALAKSFAIAYARYEDFVKLEQAKAEVESAMNELKATQSQLIQQEKLASLGQLTAGIAHEIKNPLNFVNNFSEVSIELVDEAIEERSKGPDARDESLVDEILVDIKSNLQKVHEHGSRANGIVTSMLQHSRGGSGKLDPTDLNALVKEYVNLSFHGMRAGKNPIDVEIAFDLDPKIKEVPLIKEDFIRVIINLCNNAFDAMRGKRYEVQSTKYEVEEGNDVEYLPKLRVSSTLENGRVRISIEDNGPGIPDEIKDKILQPFFTTKKGTEGTGLGLSITHDIVKAHGGELEIETSINKGTTFIIKLSR
ncbi:His Kinase A (phospho-acceptor) domain-containing protein [Algoriphagus alkaliphilus]|uniref:histidine kinase n=1 Tax=Algoriphagus alkaliphilus TaxID=279824 RepID=A0A1G5YXJ8_9BACT|nr:ATP-binding protein [Algoriphagus alkaliphilus]SDA87499.1 His Kinase A (phospho-acceptor) domain-containing protein [Algoriphagus alkaliphilus]